MRKITAAVFNDGILIPQDLDLVRVDGSDFENVVLELPARPGLGCRYRPRDTSTPFYKVDSLDEVAFEETHSEKPFYELTSSKRGGSLPDTISWEKWSELSQSFKNYYDAVSRTEVTRTPILDSETVDLTVLEIPETIQEWSTRPASAGAWATLYYGRDFERVWVVDVNLALARVFPITAGRSYFITTSKVVFLSKPWDGSTTKILDKKSNGRPYADKRGRYSPSYEAIDFIQIPSVDDMDFSSYDEAVGFIAKLGTKLIEPGERKDN